MPAFTAFSRPVAGLGGGLSGRAGRRVLAPVPGALIPLHRRDAASSYSSAVPRARPTSRPGSAGQPPAALPSYAFAPLREAAEAAEEEDMVSIPAYAPAPSVAPLALELPRAVESPVDDPRLANPLARLERMSTGWMGVSCGKRGEGRGAVRESRECERTAGEGALTWSRPLFEWAAGGVLGCAASSPPSQGACRST
jgi:hypothetical protein